MLARLRPDEPFCAAGARYQREQNDKMDKHLPGTLEGEDPEELHDMRVASRRLRAAMLVFDPCFRRSDYRRWYRRVSRLTDALGAPRDLDVQMMAIDERRRALPSEQQADADAFAEGLRTKRDAARREMIRVLQRWQRRKRGRALDRLLHRMAERDALAILSCLLAAREAQRG